MGKSEEAGSIVFRGEYIDIIVDKGPGPNASIVEIEDAEGRSIRVGQWLRRGHDGQWALRIYRKDWQEHGEAIETTPGMWEMLSELLDGEKLPNSLNRALYALRDGRAVVVTNTERCDKGAAPHWLRCDHVNETGARCILGTHADANHVYPQAG